MTNGTTINQEEWIVNRINNEWTKEEAEKALAAARKQIEYKILNADSAEKLSLEVTKHYKNGWNIIGGAFVKDDLFYQTITFYPNTSYIPYIPKPPKASHAEVRGRWIKNDLGQNVWTPLS